MGCVVLTFVANHKLNTRLHINNNFSATHTEQQRPSFKFLTDKPNFEMSAIAYLYFVEFVSDVLLLVYVTIFLRITAVKKNISISGRHSPGFRRIKIMYKCKKNCSLIKC